MSTTRARRPAAAKARAPAARKGLPIARADGARAEEDAAWPRSRDEQNAAWDRDAMATVGPLCAEPGCLHSTQRRYPGLAAAVLDWCPVHAEPHLRGG